MAKRASPVGRPPTAAVIAALPAVAGVWLLLAPPVLDHGARAAWNDAVVGLLLITLAAVRAAQPAESGRVDGAYGLLGVWMMAAPFALAYGSGPYAAARWNDVLVGVLVVLAAAASAGLRRDRAHQLVGRPSGAPGRGRPRSGGLSPGTGGG